MEHFISKHFSSFLENNDFFSESQHGFRRGFSTTTQLLHMTNEILAIMDRGGQVDIIFLDFEKAFDRVPHKKMMMQLKSIICSEQTLRWLDSYLTHRKQFVSIGASNSSLASVLSGVPQGSVLGPLLFLIYLNDLACKFAVWCRFFADDCIVYSSIRSVDDQSSLTDYLI